jgi:hypothetical protein
MARFGLICKKVASDGCRRANPLDKGPIGGRAGLKQARQPDFGRTDAVGFIVD